MKIKNNCDASRIEKSTADAAGGSRSSFVDIYISEISETRDFVRALYEDSRNVGAEAKHRRTLVVARG
jgi:hypothetical protein